MGLPVGPFFLIFHLGSTGKKISELVLDRKIMSDKLSDVLSANFLSSDFLGRVDVKFRS